MLTLQFHSDVETLLKPAVRTSFALGLVNDTASLGHTIVHLFVLHSALEEAFARLTSQKAIVIATHFVTTNRAQVVQDVLGVWLVRLAGHGARLASRASGASVVLRHLVAGGRT